MITGDLDAALRPLAGSLPGLTATDPGGPPRAAVSSAGTWRPVPGPGAGPARLRAYATTLPFRLAEHRAGAPRVIASTLAAGLRPLAWVETATVTGGGYLTVTVTPLAMAMLAVRITEAGPACARSSALAGTSCTAPVSRDLSSAFTWDQAREWVIATATGMLAGAAGAEVHWTSHDAKRMTAANPPPDAGTTSVADAVAFAGADAVRFALARLPPSRPARLDPRLIAAHHAGNPAYAVRYAHAHAASVLRRAADLGFGLGEAAGFQPRLLAHPAEQSLLYDLSWLPERVSGAARRRQPDVLARYLEELAECYLGCQESCPAVPPGMRAAQPAPGLTVARLWLAAAAGTALRSGLDLLGVRAPDRL